MEQTLYPNRWKSIPLLLACIGFIAKGIAMISREGDRFGWALTLFFGFSLVLNAIIFLTRIPRLKLSKAGFEVCSLTKTHFTPWSDVEEFGVGYGLSKRVVFKSKPHVVTYKTLRAFNRSVTKGWDGLLPDSFGLTHTKLADLLNSYLAKEKCS